MSFLSANRGATHQTKRRPSERVARVFAYGMITLFAFAATWGMFGAAPGGHYAAVDGCAISAENMIQWKILAPVWDYVAAPPTPAMYYCHHPFGTFWAQVPLLLLGHHHFFVFVPAALSSILTIVLLYDIGRIHWGAVGGAACAGAFGALPITLSFSNFGNLEVYVLLGWALFFWGYSRLGETWKRRYAMASVLGVAIACVGDWPGYVAIAVVLGWALVRAYVLPRRITAPVRVDRYAQWWALSTAMAVGWLLVWIALLIKFDKLADLVGSAHSRSSGSELPLSAVLAARTHRIDLMFTPPAILIGKIMLPVAVLRFAVTRRDSELYSVAVWIAATVQYVVFKNGADVHIFWPHYFGMYFALVVAQLADTVRWAVAFLLNRFSKSRPLATKIATGVGLSVAILIGLAILPDGLRSLRYGRETAGRYNQEHLPPETDQARVIAMLSKRLPPGTLVDSHSSVYWGWNCTFALHGLHKEVAVMPSRADATTDPFFYARLSAMRASDVKELARGFKLEIYGDIVVVDKRMAPGLLDAYTFEEREPNVFEWFAIGAVDPVITLKYDAHATWEWRTHLEQSAERPSGAAYTLQKRRIEYNIAVESGDDARARALRASIEAELDVSVAAPLADGGRLIGVRHVEGVSQRLEMWFYAGAQSDADSTFGVRARMEGKNPWSFIPPDTLDRDVGALMPIGPRLWKKGFLYVATSTLYHRIGTEVFYGGFSPGPRILPDNKWDLATYR